MFLPIFYQHSANTSAGNKRINSLAALGRISLYSKDAPINLPVMRVVM
ncbi:hypothetical protein GPAL_2620 [Glaciecola pallidula DSM 14239 = ACAM 615]|uniref:Uncharacterized protein n=1 Tax=Brumicola pallidula DSM 14239 = ACAM 615 TaxID=1121922 RepID=K6Y9Q4_9ALTE|nr:hypothetical protein GPAL_2620 [Glaciecola pallidula DSM 14239 = ACAM 615]